MRCSPGTISFITEAIENIPAGWRARETGKPFALYSRARLKRVR